MAPVGNGDSSSFFIHILDNLEFFGVAFTGGPRFNFLLLVIDWKIFDEDIRSVKEIMMLKARVVSNAYWMFHKKGNRFDQGQR